MYQDFKELLAKLNEHKVKYLIVGGYAVGFYAEPRATKDLDLLLGDDLKNATAAHAALKSFGAPIKGIKPADLIEKGSFFRIGHPPMMIDILPEAKGVDFKKAWSRREAMTIDRKSKLKAWVISCEDLITSKIAAGRLQDLADVEALRAAADIITQPVSKRKRGPKP